MGEFQEIEKEKREAKEKAKVEVEVKLVKEVVLEQGEIGKKKKR